MNFAASEARKATTPATSSTLPTRPIGVACLTMTLAASKIGDNYGRTLAGQGDCDLAPDSSRTTRD